ncbi:MAG TPA: hypothetical protein VH988_06490 [Thermoanaerobaculia bacterium]|nr:hypothetical protein [Thermoanaerobaculia bacterium]
MARDGDHFVSKNVLDALRSADPNPAFDLLYSRCLNWVRLRGDLPQDKRREIVSDSIMEELDSIRSPDLDSVEVSKRLLRALGRNRKRALRSRNREVELKEFNSALVAFNGFEEKIEAEHMLEVTRLIKGFFGPALDSLSDRDYNLLYEKYQLQTHGIKPREAKRSLEDLNPNARKTALSRARIRLLNELERQLSLADAVLGNDHLVVRDALQLLRSGSMLRNGRK